MLDKLEAIYHRYLEIEKLMNDPGVMADMKSYIKLSKDYKELQPVIKAYKEYKLVMDNITHTKEILYQEKDEEFRAMAKEELNDLIEKRDTMEEDIRLMLIPSDPQDGKKCYFGNQSWYRR
jgi:peptide chain release factor 1